MMQLLETMNIIATWNSSKKIVFTKVFWNLSYCSNITTNCSKVHCKYLRKTQKYLLIKSMRNESPWQHMHITQPMWASARKRHKQLTKRQLKTHTKEPSLWEWTKGYPINFLPPSAWREQCPRAVISAEVKRMKRLHDLPQNCTFSGRGAETKLSKLQQIDAINVKNN